MTQHWISDLGSHHSRNIGTHMSESLPGPTAPRLPGPTGGPNPKRCLPSNGLCGVENGTPNVRTIGGRLARRTSRHDDSGWNSYYSATPPKRNGQIKWDKPESHSASQTFHFFVFLEVRAFCSMETVLGPVWSDKRQWFFSQSINPSNCGCRWIGMIGRTMKNW